jgi:hypothetical protein
MGFENERYKWLCVEQLLRLYTRLDYGRIYKQFAHMRDPPQPRLGRYFFYIHAYFSRFNILVLTFCFNNVNIVFQLFPFFMKYPLICRVTRRGSCISFICSEMSPFYTYMMPRHVLSTFCFLHPYNRLYRWNNCIAHYWQYLDVVLVEIKYGLFISHNTTSCVVTYKQTIFYVYINTTGMAHLKCQ